MAYPGLPRVPTGFTDLYAAWTYPLPKPGDKHTCDMIGVCVDFLPVSMSRGTDYTMKLTLHDPYFAHGNGMQFQLFFKEEAMAPSVRNQGDVVVFRQAGTYHHAQRGKIAWSGNSSSWAVIENESLSNSMAEDYSDVVIHTSRHAPTPTAEQIKYAKAILNLEDSTLWQAPAKATSLQINSIMAANGGTPRTSSHKSKLINQLIIPKDGKLYVDLVAEVRRSYTTDQNMEIFVTDYTENPGLYDYRHESGENSFDAGDRFGYVESGGSHRSWPGPWGKRTFNVLLWEPHRSFALANVKHGSLVSLKNVHIKEDLQAAKLEGVCHTDRLYPDRVLIATLKPTEATSIPLLRDLLKRKQAYEEHCKKSGLRFIRDADPNKVLSANSERNTAQSGLEEAPREPKKAKRNRKQKGQQRARKAALDAARNVEPTRESENSDIASSLAPNAHVRTVTSDQSTIRIDEILDPQTRLQTTAAGNTWIAPFVNRRYKAKVKVVDFYPDRLEDFAVRVKRNEYADAGLSGAESEEDIEMGSDNDNGSISSNGSGQKSQDDDENTSGKGKWQWRFALIIEDPNSAANPHHQGQVKDNSARKQLTLIVSGPQAEYLLRDSACNLRKNPRALALLREKMFVLWGDLEERRKKMWAKLESENAQDDDVQMEEAIKKAMAETREEHRSLPFECFIEEYGVLKEKGLQGDRMEHWERCFRMAGTTIA